MLLDAFNQALAFFNGTPRRVLIDNAKTMVCFMGRSKYREYHPRFLALLNHYLIEPVLVIQHLAGKKAKWKTRSTPFGNACLRPS